MSQPTQPPSSGQSVQAQPQDLKGWERWLFWLGGADADIASQCARTEQNSIKNMGRLTTVPAIIGFGSMAFFIHNQTHSLASALLGGVVWAAIILVIDVAILSTYSPLDNIVAKTIKIIVRLTMAIGVGVMISHPLMLISFRDVIKDRWASSQEVELRRLRELRDKQLVGVDESRKKKLDAVAAELAEMDKKIYAVEESKPARIAAARGDKVKGASTQLDSIAKEMAENVTERAKLTAERELVQNDVNNNTLYLNQEMQFGLNAKDDGINPSNAQERALKKARKPGRDFSQAEINGGPDGNPPSKAPRMKAFMSLIEQGKARISVIDSTVASLSKRHTELQGQQDKLRDAMSEGERAAVDAAVAAVNEAAGKEIDALKKLREPIQAKQAELMADNGKSTEKEATGAYDQRLQDLTLKLEQLKNGTLVLDSMVQTRMLFSEVFDPRRDGEALDPGQRQEESSVDKLARLVAGVFELGRYFFIFMLLDLVPIVMKITKKPGEYDYMVEGELQRLRSRHRAGGGGFGGGSNGGGGFSAGPPPGSGGGSRKPY